MITTPENRVQVVPWVELSRLNYQGRDGYIVHGWAAAVAWNGQYRITSGNGCKVLGHVAHAKALSVALNMLQVPCHVTCHLYDKRLFRNVTEYIPKWRAQNWKVSIQEQRNRKCRGDYNYNIANTDIFRGISAAMLIHDVEYIEGCHKVTPWLEQAQFTAAYRLEEIKTSHGYRTERV